MRVFALSIAISLAAATFAGPGHAAQDTPMTVNGVTAVCTGVGSAQDDPQWRAYPVKIVLATAHGADLAGAHVTLTSGGKTLVATDCDAPWVLFKAPAGHYTATATLIGGSGQSHSTNFSTSGKGPQQELTLVFTPAAP